MKIALTAIALWGVGIVVGLALFDGAAALQGYMTIFAWWFVAYFLRNSSARLADVAVTTATAAVVLVILFALGFYHHIYHDAPSQLSIGFLVVVLVHSAIVASPLLFNRAVSEVLRLFARSKGKAGDEV